MDITPPKDDKEKPETDTASIIDKPSHKIIPDKPQASDDEEPAETDEPTDTKSTDTVPGNKSDEADDETDIDSGLPTDKAAASDDPDDHAVGGAPAHQAPLMDNPKKRIEPVDEAGVRQTLADDAADAPAKETPDMSTVYQTPSQPTEPDPALAVQIPTPDHRSEERLKKPHSVWDTIRGLFKKQ